MVEEEVEVGEALILLLLDGVAHEVSAEQFVGFEVLSFKDQALDFGEDIVAAFDDGGVGAAGPVGVFVELESLFVDTAEDHGAEASVADGEGFVPFTGGGVEPDGVGRISVFFGGCGCCEGEHYKADQN